MSRLARSCMRGGAAPAQQTEGHEEYWADHVPVPLAQATPPLETHVLNPGAGRRYEYLERLKDPNGQVGYSRSTNQMLAHQRGPITFSTQLLDVPKLPSGRWHLEVWINDRQVGDLLFDV